MGRGRILVADDAQDRQVDFFVRGKDLGLEGFLVIGPAMENDRDGRLGAGRRLGLVGAQGEPQPERGRNAGPRSTGRRVVRSPLPIPPAA